MRGSDSLPPNGLFYDGFNAIGGADQRDIGATVGEQTHRHDARNTVNGIFQRDSVEDLEAEKHQE